MAEMSYGKASVFSGADCCAGVLFSHTVTMLAAVMARVSGTRRCGTKRSAQS